MQEVKRYSIYIPSLIHRDLKIYAAKRGTSISALVIKLINKFFEEELKK